MWLVAKTWWDVIDQAGQSHIYETGHHINWSNEQIKKYKTVNHGL